MAASFPLAAMLAVACSFAALLPASAVPVMTVEMEPHDVTDDYEMATTDATYDQEIENLQETFLGEWSDWLLKLIIGLEKERAAQRAANTTTEPTVQVDIESNTHRRFLRSADSTPGYSANPPEVDAFDLSSDPNTEFTSYPATDDAPTQYGAYPHGIAQYAPAHYVPPSARNLERNLSHAEATTPAPKSATSAPASNSTDAQAVAPSPESENLTAMMDIWKQFLTEPRQENYDKFVAHLPAKSVQSLLVGHQYFDFKSVQDNPADKEGFISTMQKVYHVPKEQLEEVGNFFDMMTKVLPTKYFDKGRSLADLIRQIRFYFAMKHPRVKVMASEAVARYNIK